VLHLDRLDDLQPAPALTDQFLIDALDKAATYVEANLRYWNEYSDTLALFMTANEVSPPRRPEGAAVNMLHGGAIWDLEPGQALVIELDEPDATYWSVQTYLLGWMQPLDFTHHVTSLNDAQIRVDDDGKVRIVVAGQDPGVQNWLDTTGLSRGLVTYRYVRSPTSPSPTATVVPLDELREHLPAATPAWTASERGEQIDARRRGVARRFRR
jgi:hypothetical protein